MAGVILWVVCPKGNAAAFLSLIPSNGKKPKRCFKGVSAFSSAVANPARSSEERVYDVVLKQAALAEQQRGKRVLGSEKRDGKTDGLADWDLLNKAYDRCGEVCAEYAKTFYLVWCRRTDELVDGPNASHITPRALDRWEKRLDDLFEGRPYDIS